MDKLKAFIDAAEREVANHSIYVWGASGQLCKDINEKWIRSKEARCEDGKHADDAVAAWKAVMDSEYADVARAFDCSGFVSYCLIQAKALDKRRDCDGLYSKCEPTDKLTDGTLLFRVSSTNPNDETHVGIYINGLQYHAKGRCFGVVKESYAPRYWAKSAWFKALPHEVEPQPEPQPEPPAPDPDHEPAPEPPEPLVQIKVKGRVRVRAGNGVLSRKIATVGKRGGVTYIPYCGQACEAPYWYMTQVNGQDGYISSDPKYTELICG